MARSRERDIRVRPARRARPDVRAIARVLIELALAEAEKEAQAADNTAEEAEKTA